MGVWRDPVLYAVSASQCHERFRGPDKDLGDRHQRHSRIAVLQVYDDGFMRGKHENTG